MKRSRARTAGVGSPLSRGRVIDLYFIEHRGKVLDLAAFLDRVDRAPPGKGDSRSADFRAAALRQAIKILLEHGRGGKGGRARRILELWSDPTALPIPAADTKGAAGAHPLKRPARGRRKGDGR